MAFAHGVVIEVMSGGDLHTACTEFRIHIIIGDDRDLTIGQRKRNGFADQMLIPGILWVHCHRRITEHGLRPCGGHHQMS